MDDVLVTREGAVATVTLNRPDRLNAMSLAMVEHLRAELGALAVDGDVQAVVLTGATAGALTALVRSCTTIVEMLRSMPQPVIAAVNGPCAGAGMSLACAADLRIAAEGAVFTTAFVAAGQTGDYGLAWTLPRLVGTGRARELFLTARRVDAAEAARIGLVEDVAPADELMARAGALAAAIAGRAPLTVAGIKASLVDGEALDLGPFLDLEAQRYEANARTEDATEAARAFVEKRDPVFRGR